MNGSNGISVNGVKFKNQGMMMAGHWNLMTSIRDEFLLDCYKRGSEVVD